MGPESVYDVGMLVFTLRATSLPRGPLFMIFEQQYCRAWHLFAKGALLNGKKMLSSDKLHKFKKFESRQNQLKIGWSDMEVGPSCHVNLLHMNT